MVEPCSRLADRLFKEIETAVREVEIIKCTLAGDGSQPGFNQPKGGGEVPHSYLGLCGASPTDRAALLDLLHAGMQQVDRLREKEVEILRAGGAGRARLLGKS